MNHTVTTENMPKSIDLLELLRNIWKRIWILIALAIVGMLLLFVKVEYFTADTYTSSGHLLVSTRSEALTVSDLNAAHIVAQTYTEILKLPSFYDDVSAHLGEGYTSDRIAGRISVSPINETELLRITVTAPTDDEAYTIAEAALLSAKDKLKSVYKSGEIEIVNHAAPGTLNSKKLQQNLIIGALGGILMGVFIIFLLMFFDTKVRRGEDAAKRYAVPLLGEIAQY